MKAPPEMIDEKNKSIIQKKIPVFDSIAYINVIQKASCKIDICENVRKTEIQQEYRRYRETDTENGKYSVDTEKVQLYNSSCTPKGVHSYLILII